MENGHKIRGVFWGDSLDEVMRIETEEKSIEQKWSLVDTSEVTKKISYGEEAFRLQKKASGFTSRLDYIFGNEGLCRIEFGFYYSTLKDNYQYYDLEGLYPHIKQTLISIYGESAKNLEKDNATTWVVHNDGTGIDLYNVGHPGPGYTPNIQQILLVFYQNGAGGVGWETPVFDCAKEEKKVLNFIAGAITG